MSFQRRTLLIVTALLFIAVLGTTIATTLTLNARHALLAQAEENGVLVAQQFATGIQVGDQFSKSFRLVTQGTINKDLINAIWATDDKLNVLATRQVPELGIRPDLGASDWALLEKSLRYKTTFSSLEGEFLKVSAPTNGPDGQIAGAVLLYLPATRVMPGFQNGLIWTLPMALCVCVAAVWGIGLLTRQITAPAVTMIAAAAAVEAGTFAPEQLAALAKQPDVIGQLASALQKMGTAVINREKQLKQELQDLHIAIDEERKTRQVAEVTETDNFHNLQKKATELRSKMSALGDKAIDYQPGGISATDLAELPPGQQAIMRLILRKTQMTYPEICLAAESLPESQRLNQAQIDEVLILLSQQQWLSSTEESGVALYKVNLRRHGGTFGKSNNRGGDSPLSKAIWDALDSAGTPDSETPKKRKTQLPPLDF
jgi:hypothetical protein